MDFCRNYADWYKVLKDFDESDTKSTVFSGNLRNYLEFKLANWSMMLPFPKSTIPCFPRARMRILVAIDGAKKWSATTCEIRKCGYSLGGDAIFAFTSNFKCLQKPEVWKIHRFFNVVLAGLQNGPCVDLVRNLCRPGGAGNSRDPQNVFDRDRLLWM